MSKYPRSTARKIANDLNKKDPFNNYLVSFELGLNGILLKNLKLKE